jgi:predicted RNA methylase
MELSKKSEEEVKEKKVENLKKINEINQLFHNKGVKQDERFNILIELLEKNKKNIEEEKFNDILKVIKGLDYTNKELMQEIYMTIGSKYTKCNLDQYYTPLTISKFISEMMETGGNNNAIDPAGGTGDLLLYYKGKKTIWDIDENALKLCKLNYELNKETNYELECKNALERYEGSESKYTYVALNPPFGSNTVVTNEDILKKFELGKGKRKQEIGILFIELGLKLLKENGIMFVIVPGGYVGNVNKGCSEMRDMILRNRLIASISLPENSFKRSGTGVNTYLLIIEKRIESKEESYKILISKINNIGYNLTKKETPLKYKIEKETGELKKENGKAILDNDLEELYDKISIYGKENKIIGMKKKKIELEIEYEYIKKESLCSNILDIKRYLKKYIDVVESLKSLGGVSLKSLCKIIKTGTKIEKTKLYKYIDISEITSPMYGYKSLYGWELPSRGKYRLEKYDILVSKLEGNMSYCVILDESENYIATNGVCVIRPKNINMLYIIFSNIMSSGFRCQHNAYLTGSIMASLTDEDIGEFLINEKTVDIEMTKKILETLEKLQKLRV